METNFWEEIWVGDTTLRAKFPRLFNLSSNKLIKVGEAGKWSNGRWTWVWKWRRPLLEREVSLVDELKEMIKGVQLKQAVLDKWKWEVEGDGKYTVRKAYEAIAKTQNLLIETPREVEYCRFTWKTIAPLKQQMVAWRAIWNRLPTKENLHRRIGLSAEERKCVYCGGSPETAQHLFLGCKEMVRIWDKMVGWIGV